MSIDAVKQDSHSPFALHDGLQDVAVTLLLGTFDPSVDWSI